MATDTKDILKALVDNRNIQDAMEALRKANMVRGSDFVSTFTVTIKQSGVEMALQEGNKKESFFQRTDGPDRPLKKEVARLKEKIEPIIREYIDNSYVGISDEKIKGAVKKVSKVAAIGIGAEIDREIESTEGDKNGAI